MKFLRHIFLTLPLTLSAEAHAAGQSSVVAVFGDSITVGENSSNPALSRGFGAGRTNYGPPDKELSNILNSSGRPSVVVNWGAGGSPSGPSGNPGIVATTNGLERISSNLATTKGVHSADKYYVLIMYGTNDANWSIGSSTTGFNIRGMIDRARSRGYTPVIGTILPKSGLSSSYNSEIINAANQRGAPIVDHHAVFTSMNWPSLLDDGIHPTNAGYLLVAETWFKQYLSAEISSSANLASIITLLLLDEEVPE